MHFFPPSRSFNVNKISVVLKTPRVKCISLAVFTQVMNLCIYLLTSCKVIKKLKKLNQKSTNLQVTYLIPLFSKL